MLTKMIPGQLCLLAMATPRFSHAFGPPQLPKIPLLTLSAPLNLIIIHQKPGLLPTRRAIADYLSRDLPYTLSPDDVFLTVGCIQAIEVTLMVLACPGANILLPRPCFPSYDAHASSNNLEVRYFDLIPEKGWEVDIEGVEALADENTVAMVVINPGNPCGSVYTHI